MEVTTSGVLPSSDLPTLPVQVLKRDGALRPFDGAKIRSALARAGAATGEYGMDAAARLAAHVVAQVAARHATPSIEDIQDTVEKALIDAGYVDTARAYIVYREQTKRLREDRHTVVDVDASMNEYLERQDCGV